MVRFFFSILRKFNDGIPTRIEVDYCISLIDGKDLYISMIIRSCMVDYVEGKTLEQIGNSYTCTRERVRQILMKGCRVAYDIL